MRTAVGCFTAFWMLAVPVLAQPPSAAQPLTLHEAVAAAWARDPQRNTIDARQNTAAARYAAGGAFFPNAPVLTGSHVNDKVAGSNYNYITTQAELDTPVWLPGQGTATQQVAAAEAVTAVADAEAAHLALAATVLDLAARAALATNTRDVARRRLQSSSALALDTQRRFRVGEGSESDALAADAEAAGARVTLSGAEAQLGSALAALATVTGAPVVPRLADAPAVLAFRRPGANRLASHPRVIAAERAVAAAQEQVRLVRIENRDSPQIGVEGINEKQPGTRWDTRFGVVVHFPFATEARNAPRRAAAEQAVTQAIMQLELARRQVLAGVQQATALLEGAEQATVAARRAADALDKRSGQIERAWRLGEMPLIEVVRAKTYAFDANLAWAKAQTELYAARQSRLLADGVMP